MTDEEHNQRIFTIAIAVENLHGVRNDLRRANAKRAAAAVGRAIKSVDGALRHARNLYDREYPQ